MSAPAAEVLASGDLGSTSVRELLQSLEEKGATARIRFEGDLGESEVDMIDGRVVDAFAGETFGQAALLGLLDMAGGRFEVTSATMADRPAIVPSVAQLFAEKARRVDEWRELSVKAPPLTTTLSLTEAGRKALPSLLATPAHGVLSLVDGRKTLGTLLEQCDVDAVSALGIVVEAITAGRITAGPAAAPIAAAPIISVTMAPPEAGGERDAEHPKGLALRKHTVIGLGSQLPEAVSPRRSSRRPSAAPEPVAPRVRTSLPAPADAPDSSGVRATDPPSVGESNEAKRSRPGAKFIGRYELLQRIGYGGMGTVYLCRLTSESGFRRLFALKVLRQHLLHDDDASQKFLQEARIAGQMHHPNVVSVLDAGIIDAQPYLVMDYVEGGSLKQLLSSSATRSPDVIVPVILDALAGLHATHTLTTDDGAPLAIVHCDVSPENLLVGTDGVCRLTDFGVARNALRDAGPAEPRQGKPSYMAPEQIAGARVDRRADIFALGVVFYNALTGVKLFDGNSVEEILDRVRRQPIAPPSGVGHRPPPSLDAICLRALERDPGRRFASAEDMMVELRRVALYQNLLAPSSMIANWVVQAVGAELSQRRLAILDAARRVGVRQQPVFATNAGPSAGNASLPAAFNEAAVPSPLQDAAGAPEQTLSLPPDKNAARRAALIIASAVAIGAVLATLLWPDRVSRLFKLSTGAVVSDTIQVAPSSGPSGTPDRTGPPSASSVGAQ